MHETTYVRRPLWRRFLKWLAITIPILVVGFLVQHYWSIHLAHKRSWTKLSPSSTATIPVGGWRTLKPRNSQEMLERLLAQTEISDTALAKLRDKWAREMEVSQQRVLFDGPAGQVVVDP